MTIRHFVFMSIKTFVPRLFYMNSNVRKTGPKLLKTLHNVYILDLLRDFVPFVQF